MPPPSQGGGDGHLTDARPLMQQQQQQQLCPSSTRISPLTPARSSCDTGAGNSSHPTLTSQTGLPGRRGPQTPSSFFFVKGRKTAPRHRRIQHLKKYYCIMLFHLFNIGGIMTKSKQTQLAPLPQGTPKGSAPGERKRGACCREAVLTKLNMVLKTLGNGAYFFFL